MKYFQIVGYGDNSWFLMTKDKDFNLQETFEEWINKNVDNKMSDEEQLKKALSIRTEQFVDYLIRENLCQEMELDYFEGRAYSIIYKRLKGHDENPESITYFQV